MCFRVTGEGAEGGERRLGGDGCQGIVVCIYYQKVGIREVHTDNFQGSRGVSCGFIKKKVFMASVTSELLEEERINLLMKEAMSLTYVEAWYGLYHEEASIYLDVCLQLFNRPFIILIQTKYLSI